VNPKLISAKELAVRYSVAPKTVRKWARCSVLPVVKLTARCLRFDVEKCDEILARRTRISGHISTCALIATGVLLSPFLIALLATNWPHFPNPRETPHYKSGRANLRLRGFRRFFTSVLLSIREGNPSFGLRDALALEGSL
jgi:hypothetical protein